jgi:uncharacterized lipoprotein YddW (UPF0748 family)
MYSKLITLFLVFLMALPVMGQGNPLKREFRGAWIALVRNEDWPSQPGISTAEQKQELRLILDELQANNINSVIFQIRPECDAIYQSNYEPWSYWLTGVQGQAPSPFYDPLQFAIDEAHKRGMELHAWFNPYRAESNAGDYPTDPIHVTNTQPDWVLDVTGFKFLNPGLPEVRDYIVDIILDVTTNYNVDGVHLDDYFYPYPSHQITTQDTATFSLYPRGFTDIGDWRRDNVHLLVEAISDTLASEMPHLKFGISPFGIWKNGVPAGITGMDAYNVIYCDPVTWIENQWLDYMTPQLYWPFGGQQDYGTLLPWWSNQINGRHLYSGMGLYKAYAPTEYGAQIDLNRTDPNTNGSVFFKASNFLTNTAFTNYLQTNHFKYKALPPVMDWKSMDAPNAPSNLRYESLAGERGDGLVWDVPGTSGNAAEAFMYVVYRLSSMTYTQADLDDPANIAAISGTNFAFLPEPPPGESTFYFGVASLSRNYVEGGLSEVIQVEIVPPGKTDLEFPENGNSSQPENVLLRWRNADHSSTSKIQIAEDNLFTNIIFEKEEIRDTFIVASGFTGQTKYFWRVSSSNYAGEGEFSDTWSFTTNFPIPPVLSDPPHTTTNVSTTPTLTWFSAPAATDYNLQVYLGTAISPSGLQVDTLVTDTVCTITTQLLNNRIHSWRVSSSNSLGFGGWSESFGFKTEVTTDVKDDLGLPTKYSLNQNYPNPFNPSTTINFSLPYNGFVTIKIYDVLGKEISTIINNDFAAGYYDVNFDASALSSGIYFYQINVQSAEAIDGNFVETKKMLLLK